MQNKKKKCSPGRWTGNKIFVEGGLRLHYNHDLVKWSVDPNQRKFVFMGLDI